VAGRVDASTRGTLLERGRRRAALLARLDLGQEVATEHCALDHGAKGLEEGILGTAFTKILLQPRGLLGLLVQVKAVRVALLLNHLLIGGLAGRQHQLDERSQLVARKAPLLLAKGLKTLYMKTLNIY